MAIVPSNLNSGLTLAGYCARVAFAIAVIAIGVKITADHWPCEMAGNAACQRLALSAGAPPPSPATVAFAGTSGSSPLKAIAGKLAAAAEGQQLGAKIAGIARPPAQAPSGP